MEEHSKEFLEKLKGLLAFAKEHKNALEDQEIVDYFKGISLTETQSEKILDYLDEHGVDVLRQKDADALEELEEERLPYFTKGMDKRENLWNRIISGCDSNDSGME